MASIIREILVDASADKVWDAVADFGAVHTRFAPGFVVDTQLEEGARVVTFGNGMVARELFLGADHGTRRLAYSVRTERFEHHSASFQVTDAGDGRSRLVWTADVLPDAIAPMVAGMMEQGLKAAEPAVGRIPA